MIPKIIHYCWFGRGEKPKLAERCIDSWKKYCPDYEIIEWNEDNFDINSNRYVRQAYENKKFAFVADYVRLYAMYKYGGVYMDTDVELEKPIDSLLYNKGFSGFESESYVAAGIMGCEKGFPLIGKWFSYYGDISFVDDDGNLNTTTNVKVLTELLVKSGLKTNGEYQVIDDFVLYPRDFFYPFEDTTGILKKTENTVAVHWYDKSWIDKKSRIRSKLTRPFHRIFGENCFEWLKR